jgi:tetratricopeptide (TPR) repeat protein
MPFGKKIDSSGHTIDFDTFYQQVLHPAIESAGMEPLRADEERDGGIIHKPMFERLVLCQFAVADLTLANANVFYELGVRHAVRPHTTVLVYNAGGQRLPFDVAPLRAIPYEVDASGTIQKVSETIDEIALRLKSARDPVDDSPLYQLLDGIVPPDLARLKTDVFRDQVSYSLEIKKRLAQARKEGVSAIELIQNELEPLIDREAGVLVDLLLSYRDTSSYEQMITVVEQMPNPVSQSVTIQEQYALALNRLGRRDEAQEVLEDLIHDRGPSSETYGLLGRIHKDRWHESSSLGRESEARAHLRHAIETYTLGFESDWRDAFPGVNALTLLEVEEPHQSDFLVLLPVVEYAVAQRLLSGAADYWDHASMLEIACLKVSNEIAQKEVSECLASKPQNWQRETTTRNLQILFDARSLRGENVDLLIRILELLK